MKFVITSECVSCGMCVEVCPVSAIIDENGKMEITDSCISCGACKEVCPIDAIRGKKK